MIFANEDELCTKGFLYNKMFSNYLVFLEMCMIDLTEAIERNTSDFFISSDVSLAWSANLFRLIY